MYACLAVTCHLHFWQNDRDFLRATVVTRGWNGYRNKSQHRKSTLEKKILPPFQQGFEPATFQSRVRRSNHWAIPAPLRLRLIMVCFYTFRLGLITVATWFGPCLWSDLWSAGPRRAVQKGIYLFSLKKERKIITRLRSMICLHTHSQVHTLTTHAVFSSSFFSLSLFFFFFFKLFLVFSLKKKKIKSIHRSRLLLYTYKKKIVFNSNKLHTHTHTQRSCI